jgi:hypothetical protein
MADGQFEDNDGWGEALFNDIVSIAGATAGQSSVSGSAPVTSSETPSSGSGEIRCLICKKTPNQKKWANFRKTRKLLLPVGDACEEDMIVKIKVRACSFWVFFHITDSTVSGCTENSKFNLGFVFGGLLVSKILLHTIVKHAFLGRQHSCKSDLFSSFRVVDLK